MTRICELNRENINKTGPKYTDMRLSIYDQIVGSEVVAGIKCAYE